MAEKKEWSFIPASSKTHPEQSWTCHMCATLESGSSDRCSSCKNPRIRSSQSAGRPVPESVAHQQCSKLMGNYARWPPIQYGDQWVMVVSAMPRPLPDNSGPVKEPQEMKQLLELGWVRVEAGFYQREVEPMKVLVVGG